MKTIMVHLSDLLPEKRDHLLSIGFVVTDVLAAFLDPDEQEKQAMERIEAYWDKADESQRSIFKAHTCGSDYESWFSDISDDAKCTMVAEYLSNEEVRQLVDAGARTLATSPMR